MEVAEFISGSFENRKIRDIALPGAAMIETRRSHNLVLQKIINEYSSKKLIKQRHLYKQHVDSLFKP